MLILSKCDKSKLHKLAFATRNASFHYPLWVQPWYDQGNVQDVNYLISNVDLPKKRAYTKTQTAQCGPVVPLTMRVTYETHTPPNAKSLIIKLILLFVLNLFDAAKISPGARVDRIPQLPVQTRVCMVELSLRIAGNLIADKTISRADKPP